MLPFKQFVQAYRYRASPAMMLVGVGLLVAFVAIGLVACGSHASSAGSAGSTPTSVTRVQKCGHVQTLPDGTVTNTSSAKQAENCFWQAYQKCQPASLTFTTIAVDAGDIHDFTIRNNGQCSISDAVQHFIVPHRPTAPKTYTCAGLAQQQDGLHVLSCSSEGDIIVPA